VRLLDVLQGANVALQLLQARLITLIAMLLTAGLFGWAMYAQTLLGCIIAAIWGLIVFLPVLMTGRGGYDAPAPQRQPERPPTEGGDEPAG